MFVASRVALSSLLIAIILSVVEAEDLRLTRPLPTDSKDLIQLVESDDIVQIQQINWINEVELLADDGSVAIPKIKTGPTGWGEFVINPTALMKKLSSSTSTSGSRPSSYVNVILPDMANNRDGVRWQWVVDNMAVMSPSCSPLGDEDKDDDDDEGTSSSLDENTNMTKYFNLRPNSRVYKTALKKFGAIVLASSQPIPPTRSMVEFLLEKFEKTVFDVNQVVVAIDDGFLPSPSLETGFPKKPIDIELPVGIAPVSIPLPSGPSNTFVTPKCTFQRSWPNTDSSRNQCVPMAVANTLRWVEYEHSGPFGFWDVPHFATRGVGRLTSAGDVLSWFPDPEFSLNAQVDAYTRRANVVDFDTGNGSSLCQMYDGMFGYLEDIEDDGSIIFATFTHQGGSATYGTGGTCDNSNSFPDHGGRFSTRQGTQPTWQWIFDELADERGVFMAYGRYDVNGQRTGGHALRIYGACEYASGFYISTVDDSFQGTAGLNDGLRKKTWRVEDTSGPGGAPPDGRLNLDGTSWEIEFVQSIEAHPFVPVT